jgi:hypothetical protein
MAEAGTEVLVKVVKQLMTVLDTLELSRQNLKSQTEGEASIISKYCELEDQLINTLKTHGIETVQALGTPFDPNLHEAVQQKESDKYVEGVVCVQYQRGYRLGQKLIRPATVVVSAGPGPSAAPVQQEAVAPVVASEAVAPVVASEVVAPVVASEVVAPVVASEASEPVTPLQEAVEPVVASEAVAPVVASEAVEPVIAPEKSEAAEPAASTEAKDE